ncbi:MAG: hypothetical protein GX638_17875, partial [Crenarchaeota archaeon]|nr:hypothetical protein [Thermoproteota archaeon]
KIKLKFIQSDQDICIKTETELTSGYLKFTLLGYFLSAILMIFCIWVGWDLQSYVLTNDLGTWGWLIQSQGQQNFMQTTIIIRLMWIFIAILSSTIVLETYLIWNIKNKIGNFVEEKILRKI